MVTYTYQNVLSELLEFVHFIGCKSYSFKKDFLSLERKERGEGPQQKEWERKENQEKGSGEVGEGEVRREGAVDFGESPRTRVKAFSPEVQSAWM